MIYVDDTSDTTGLTLDNQLTKQYDSLDKDIQRREQFCDELRERLGTEAPAALVSNKRLRLDDLGARLTQLRNEIALLEWEKGQTVSNPRKEQLKYYVDAEWRKFDLALENVQREINRKLSLPHHPAMVALNKDLDYLKEQRQRREMQLDEQWRAGLVDAATAAGTDPNDPNHGILSVPVEYRLLRAKQQEQLLQAELKGQEEEFKRVFQNAQLLENEHSMLRHKQDLFAAVRQRIDQKKVERDVPGSIEILASAFVASRPARDRRMVFTGMTAFVALGLGTGLAVLRASRNQTIYTLKDMPQVRPIPFLGCVPVVRTRKPPNRSLYEETGRRHSTLVESVRMVRTALLSQLDRDGSTTVLVTSAMGRTGKSSFTIALGTSLACAGKEVLMIDADFRKRTLSAWFGLHDEPGFREALKRKSVDTQHIRATERPGLSILPAGTAEGRSRVVEELANGALTTCVQELSKRYDIILFDSSPLLPVADAAILAGQVDGTIMVERERLSQRGHVANALLRLDATGRRLLGTVFVGSAEEHYYGYSCD